MRAAREAHSDDGFSREELVFFPAIERECCEKLVFADHNAWVKQARDRQRLFQTRGVLRFYTKLGKEPGEVVGEEWMPSDAQAFQNVWSVH